MSERHSPMMQVAQQVAAAGVPGCWIEVGVHQGNTAAKLAEVVPDDVPYYLCDTFTGHPAEMVSDFENKCHPAGKYKNTSAEDVRKLIPRGTVVEGTFPDTAGVLHGQMVAYAHIDVDLYLSVKACCETLWPLMSKGGAMVFDDYGYGSAPGCKRAVNEFCDANGVILQRMHLQGVLWK